MNIMTKTNICAIAFVCVALAACQKKAEEAAAPAPAAAAPAAAAAPTAEPTQEQRERAQRQAQLDYATMEDGFLNDPHGQWAKEATATSSFGDSSNNTSDSNKPQNLVGKPDGKNWTNDNQDMGFDSIELVYEKPVHATEVRAVFNDGASTVSKLELKDVDGKYITVWSGLNEDPREQRGPRSWFVRKFDKTPNSIQGVKITIANPVSRGYKVADAVQLVGE